MKEKTLIFFCFAMVMLLAFLKLGQHPVHTWDEARNAINSIEMLNDSDWLNLHYAGQPDNWNTKPPLFIWLLAASIKILGFNELSLRLPSALAIIGAFFFTFKIIRLYRSATFAALTCLILASVKGLIGWHVGRTGDFDSLLTCLLVASVYYFLRNYDFGEKWAAASCGLCLGLAFLTKGPAAAVLLPGMMAYAVASDKTHLLTKSKEAWAGAGVAFAIAMGWFWLQRGFGNMLTGSPTLSDEPTGTASERLFSVDILKRFTQASDGLKEAFDFTFLYYSLDKNFNLWHFVFFGFIGFGLFLLVKNRSETWNRLVAERNRLLLLSLCLYLPLALFLAIAAKSNRWYLAPALPFVGIATFWGIRYFWNKAVWVKCVFTALLVFTLGRQLVLFWQVPPRPELADNPIIAQAKTIVVASRMEQDLLCYLYFYGKKMRFTAPSDAMHEGEVLVVKQSDLPETLPFSWNLAGQLGDNLIFTPKN